SLVRLAPDLQLLALSQLHDPDIARDPSAPGINPPNDLQVSGLSFDSVRMACAGEDILVVAQTTLFSVIAYRNAFVDGAWAAPRRTLIEPSGPITLLLPIGGSFDTFGAVTVTQRSFIDIDENGDAYVASYAPSVRIRRHAALFGDALTSLPGDPTFPH